MTSFVEDSVQQKAAIMSNKQTLINAREKVVHGIDSRKHKLFKNHRLMKVMKGNQIVEERNERSRNCEMWYQSS